MATNFLRKLFARKSPIEQIDPPRSGFSFFNKVFVSEDNAMQVSAFYRGVIYVSTQIAKLPWCIKDKQNAEVENEISYLLSVAPNPEMNSMTFRLQMIQQAIIHGNAIAEIERTVTGKPIALWPIPSRNFDLIRNSKGELFYRILSSGIKNQETILMRPNDIFHIRNFHTKDGLVGQGVVAYGTEVLGISLGADRFAGGLFANGGMPSGVLEVPGILSDEAFARVKKGWDENNGGRKTGGVAVLEQGAKFNPITLAPDVLQFLESRKFGVLEIARFLGVPPTKLFDTDAATFNNMENANLEVATDTLDAWAKNFEMEADIKLLSGRHGGRRTEMDLYAVFRGDMETRAKYFSQMMQIACYTPNEIRKREGLMPYEDGDKFWIAVNNYSPVDRVDELIDAKINPKSNTQPQEPPEDETEDEDDKELKQEAINFLRRK